MAAPVAVVKVRIINRPRYVAGEARPVGSVVELTPTTAKEWTYNRWAEYVKDEAPAAPARAAAPARDQERPKKSEKAGD